MQRTNLTAVRDLFAPNSPPGATALYWSEAVIVPQIQFTISNTQMELLRTIIPLEGPRGSLGVDSLQRQLYLQRHSFLLQPDLLHTPLILPYWDEGLDAISSVPLVPLNQFIFIILLYIL